MDEYDKANDGRGKRQNGLNNIEPPPAYDGHAEECSPEILDPEPTSFLGIVKAWPKQTFCIVSNEFCERFSYYGMRTVLTLYLINILKFNKNKATVFFHSFTVLAYTSPLLGSVLADGYIGKFWTIFSISLVYATGQILLSVASTFEHGKSVHPYLDLAGLLIIAIGTGGIKPCVAAFGGDQFKPHYLRMISMYFSIFYFSINAGSTISTFLTPIFRSKPCLNQDSCYPLAFGVPAALMIVATVFFMLGSFFYKKFPPKENVMARVLFTFKTAVANRFRYRNQKRPHLIEHYLDTHNCSTDPRCIALAVKDKPIGHICAQKKFCEDIQSLFRVIVMMLPVPMFWALYDQQGSRWIIQAVAMDSRITKSFSLLPDQMATLNAILIMVFIPIFQFAIYPAFKAIGVRTTPLRRMSVGGLLAVVSFVICGFVQIAVNQTLPDIPVKSEVHVAFVNALPNCTFNVTYETTSWTVPPNSSLVDDKSKSPKLHQLFRLKENDLNTKMFTINWPSTDVGCSALNGVKGPGQASPGQYQASAASFLPGGTTATIYPRRGGNGYYIVATSAGFFSNATHFDKPTEGQGQFSMSVNMLIPCRSLPPMDNDPSTNVRTWNFSQCNGLDGVYGGPLAFCQYKYAQKHKDNPCNPRDASTFYKWQKDNDPDGEDDTDAWNYNITTNGATPYNVTIYAYNDIRPGTYQAYFMQQNPSKKNTRTLSSTQINVTAIAGVLFTIDEQGGVYTLTITPEKYDETNRNFLFTRHTVVPENHVSILWQIPQYVVITAGEILFSITGLEFAYSQAAPSMKSVMQAIWLLTVAGGDLIIIIIAALDLFDNLAIEMFSYAGAMLVVMAIFSLLAMFYYQYADYTETNNRDDQGSITTGTGGTGSEDGFMRNNGMTISVDDDDMRF